MDDGVAVGVFEISKNSRLELGLRSDPDMPEHGAGHLGEQAFDEVQPRSVFGREYEGEAPFRLGGDPRLRFLGYVSRMVVQDQLDPGVRRVGRVQPLEKADELARAMAIFDAGMHVASKQINAGEQAQRAMA